MIVATTDPMSMNKVNDLEHAPYVVEGEGAYALKIYFENEANRRDYIDIQRRTPGAAIINVYAEVNDYEITGTSD
jgi:hypothetical protein